MKDLMNEEIKNLVDSAKMVAEKHIAPKAKITDEKYQWPKAQLTELGKAGLLGLHVPKKLGGKEQGLFALASVCEELGKHCMSTAMCYAMHCVGSAVIAAKATPYQEKNYLKPIAEGKHITTLALSETGTGAIFWLPETTLSSKGKKLVLNGEKDFITNGGHADSYVVSTKASIDTEKGEFSTVILPAISAGMEWKGPWRGFGLHGNSSQNCILKNVSISKDNLLGEEGEQIWYVFEIVGPYFLMGMAGAYMGAAQSALDMTIEHLKHRKHTHSGDSLADLQIIQSKIAELWIKIEETRCFVYNYARLGDLGDKSALPGILACKAAVGNTAEYIVNECLTLCGGMAYRENSDLTRRLRDIRACHIMSPTTAILKTWVGRALLDKPLL